MAKVLCSNFHDSFLQLVRLGIGVANNVSIPGVVNWPATQTLAKQQGLAAIILDGIEKLPDERRPKKELLLQWIGEVMQMEAEYAAQQKTATKMARLFQANCIRTYVLKGVVVSECYPNPSHRCSVDLDCYLIGESGTFNVWESGNNLIEAQGYDVEYEFYKNSTFLLPNLIVENHRYMVPFRGNKKLKNLELLLEAYMREDKGYDKIEGTYLYRPPVMVSALFLIEHAYSHFLHEGLTWRHVLDWMMFSRKHEKEIDWGELDLLIDEYGFRKFYDPFYRLGLYLLGETNMNAFTTKETMMLEDVWDDLALHDTALGVRGKLALAGNTIRAWWKYHHFSDISMLHALWIQTTGYLFDKHPNLD